MKPLNSSLKCKTNNLKYYTIQLPPPPYEANAVEKAFVGQLQPDPKFLPQLKILEDRFEADMKNLQQITPSVGKERVLNLKLRKKGKVK